MKQKIFGRFLILILPRFSGAPSEDASEHLTTCQDSVYNLGLVENLEVGCTTF